MLPGRGTWPYLGCPDKGGLSVVEFQYVTSAMLAFLYDRCLVLLLFLDVSITDKVPSLLFNFISEYFYLTCIAL